VLSGVVLAKGRVQLWLVSKEDKKKERWRVWPCLFFCRGAMSGRFSLW
jgi:hypothetical protein